MDCLLVLMGCLSFVRLTSQLGSLTSSVNFYWMKTEPKKKNE